MHQSGPWILAVLVAIVAGVFDWRYRRIPNWLTVSGFVIGIAVNAILSAWPGMKFAIEGALLGLGLLLPLVLVRGLGAGDWKLTGALGASLGPRQLCLVLVVTCLLAGVMALVVVIWQGRLRQTLGNMARVVGSFLTLRMPPAEVSLDNPQSAKIPFGVAMSAAVVLIGVGKAFGKL